MRHAVQLLLLVGTLLGFAVCVVGCGAEDPPGDDGVPGAGWQALVVHAPFSGDGVLAAVDGETLGLADNLLGLSGSDWIPAVAGGSPWLIGRQAIDALRRYEGLSFSAPALEFSTGAGTNPHALALCAEHLFVSRYDRSNDEGVGGDLARFEPSTGELLGSVDLSDFQPHDDGTPEPDTLVRLGGRLYVGLQRLNRNDGWIAEATGTVVEVDCSSLEITASWAVGANPRISALAGSASLLQVVHDGGVQRLDPDGGTVTELFVGSDFGDTTEILAVEGTGAQVLVATEVDWATNELWCVDLESEDRSLLASFEHRNWGLQRDPQGRVWALWRDHWATGAEVELGGIGIYDPATCTEVTEEWVRFASDPAALAFYSPSD